MHLIVRCISLIKRVSPAVEDTRYHRPITLNPPKHFKRHSDDDMLLSLFRDCRQIVCVEIKLSLWIYTRFIVCICPGEPYRCLREHTPCTAAYRKHWVREDFRHSQSCR